MTVIDTSGVVDFLLGAGAAVQVESMLEHEGEVAAPDLLVFEVLAVLRREADRGVLTAGRASGAVSDLADVPLSLFSTLALRDRAWALRHNFTIADAVFIALAEHLDEPLATKDLPLATEMVKHTHAEAIRLTAGGGGTGTS